MRKQRRRDVCQSCARHLHAERPLTVLAAVDELLQRVSVFEALLTLLQLLLDVLLNLGVDEVSGLETLQDRVGGRRSRGRWR